MTSLDIRTLSFLAMLSSLLLAVGLLLVNRVICKEASLRLWAMGASANGVAFVLLALRGVVPDLLSIVLANTLLVVGSAWLYRGNCAYQGRKNGAPWYWLVVAVSAVLLVYFTYLAPSLSARIAVLSGATALVLFASAQVLGASSDPRDRLVRWFVAGAFLVTAVSLAVRAIAMLILDSPGQDFMVLASPMHTYAHVMGIGLNTALGVGLPLLVSGRMQRQLVESESRHRTLYIRTPAILHSIDAQGTLVNVSDLWLQTLGYARGEVIGRKSSDFLTEASRQFALKDVLPEFFRSGVCVDVPYEFVAKDGRILNMRLSAISETDVYTGALRSLAIMEDVTARIGAEAALAQSESQFRAAFESAAQGMAIVTTEGGFKKVNAAFCAMIGYGEAELLATDFRAITHPDDLATHDVYVQELLRGSRAAYQMEKRYFHKSGGTIWVQLSVSLVRAKDGTPVHFVAQIQDVTESKRNQTRLEQLLTEQKAMLESELIGIVKVRNRTILWVNPAFEKMLGYGQGELSGASTRMHYPSEAAYRAFGEAAYPALANGGVFRSQIEHLRKDGEVIWVDVSGSILDRDSGDSLWGFIDVTESRMHERAIRQSEQRMELALEGADLGMWDFDTVSGRVMHNPRLLGMLGYGSDALELNASSVRSMVHPDDLDRLLRGFRAALNGEIAQLDVESRIEHKNGSWLWVRSRGKVVERGADGRPTRMAGTNSDISRRKANEAKIHELAFFDPLTSLPNRRLLMDRLSLALPSSGRHDSFGALLFLDLDNFKSLNDTKGHECGDVLLVEVARRLMACVRVEDTVSRLGGDEFIVMLESLSSEMDMAVNEARRIGAKILEAVGADYLLGDFSHTCTCSIGVALFKGTGISPGEVIKRADIAMYRAKAANRNTLRVFECDTLAAVSA